MLDIEGNRVLDEANGLYRIAVLRVGDVRIIRQPLFVLLPEALATPRPLFGV